MLVIKLKFSFIIFHAVIHARETLAGNVARGGNCTISNNHLDPATHKLLTDCDEKTFCTPQNTCEPRQCRKEEYPFGYNPGESFPPVCPQGQYCPDEGDACKPWLNLGQPCQLNRDDECAPSMNGLSRISSPDISGQSPMIMSGPGSMNSSGSVCLHLTCMYANATLGAPCITDSTSYVGTGPKGETFSNTVLRDNCVSPDLYCNATSNVCEKKKAIGLACQNDLECESYNCNTQNICVVPPEIPMKFAVWQYVVTSIAALLAMVGTCVILVLAHTHHRKQRNAEIREYYREQLGYRRSIIALHSVALKSVHTPPNPDTPVLQTCSQSANVYRGCISDYDNANRNVNVIGWYSKQPTHKDEF